VSVPTPFLCGRVQTPKPHAGLDLGVETTSRGSLLRHSPRVLYISIVALWLARPCLDGVKTGAAGQGATIYLKHETWDAHVLNIVALMWRLYKTGIGLTTGFIGSQSVTQLGYSVLHFTAHNNWLSSLPLKTPAPTLKPLLQPNLVASLAITSHNWLGTVRSWLSTSELRVYSPGTDHKENTVSDSSTVVWRHYRNRPQRKQQFLPLLRCLAAVVNKRFHCWPTACTSCDAV
jgi:hypothetical protein